MKKYFLTSLIMAGIMCLMGTKAWALEKDGDGVYQISTAQDLVDFAALVNGGETGLNAVLLNDIDMAGIEGFAGIGVPRNVLYTGIFDGHGHKISNMTISNLEATDVGLFHIGGGAVLRDFWLDETCLIAGFKEAALVGWCNAANGATLDRVGNAGKVSGGENTSALMGRGWSSSSPLQFINCWTVGEIDNSGSNGGTTGNWIGWCSNWKATFTNCWTTSTFAVAPANGNYLTRKGDNVVFNNCYTLRGSQATKMTEDDVTSGALCFNLNGDQSEIIWYQTLGEGGVPPQYRFSRDGFALSHIVAVPADRLCLRPAPSA